MRFSDNPITSIKGYPKYVYATDIDLINYNSHINKELGLEKNAYLSTEIIKDLNIYNIKKMNRTEVRSLFDPEFIKVDEAIKAKTQEATQQYKNKRNKVNQESVVYNLMKSFLLRS